MAVLNKAIPGVYMLKHPFYQGIIKIGASIDIGRRITDGDYRTMFLPEHLPKLLGYLTHDNFTSKQDVLYLEKCIHRFFRDVRYSPSRELFMIDMENPEIIEKLSIFLHNLCGNNYNFIHTNVTPLIPGPVDNRTEYNSRLTGNIIPLDYQEPIIQIICDYFVTNEIGKLILPCGYGKMYIALFYLQRSLYQNVVIFVPSLILLEQFINLARTILTEWSIYEFSGENKVPIIGHRNLIISTYHSSNLLSIIPDFIIYDEAHRTCVNKCTNEPSLFHNSITRFSNCKRMFMTATEKVSYCDDNNAMIGWYSMDSDEYGAHILQKTFKDAIEEKVICDYALAVPLISSHPVDTVISAMNELDLHHLLVYSNRREDARQLSDLLQANGINSYYLDGNHNSSERLQILNDFQLSPKSVLCSVKILQEGISLPIVDSVYFMDNKGSEIDITQMIGRALRLHPTKTLATIIITNDMIKNRNLLNTLVRMDSRDKRKIIGITGLRQCNQRLGREPLIAVGKKIEFIRLGGKDGKWEFFLELSKRFEQNNEFIKRSSMFNDEKIGKWYTAQKAIYVQHGLSDDKLTMLGQLRTWTQWLLKYNTSPKYSNRQERWNSKLELCIECEHINGKFSNEYKGIKLGDWIKMQKDLYKQNKLNEFQQEQLSRLQHWVKWLDKIKCSPEENWQEMFKMAKAYELTHGYIKQASKIGDNLVGSWLGTQKAIYRGDRKITMDPQKFQLLMELMTWRRWLTKYQQRPKISQNVDPWIFKFDLSILYEQTGKNIIHSTEYEGHKIGIWLKDQKSKNATLSAEKKEKLSNLRSWREWLLKDEMTPKHRSSDERFLFMAETAKEYEHQHGIFMSRTITNNISIGSWLQTNKASYKKPNGLTIEKCDILYEVQTWRKWLMDNKLDKYPSYLSSLPFPTRPIILNIIT